MLTLDTLTLQNTTLRSASISAQAETIYFNSEGRLIARNASLPERAGYLKLKGWTGFTTAWSPAMSTSSGAAAAQPCSRKAKSARLAKRQCQQRRLCAAGARAGGHRQGYVFLNS